MAKTMAILMMAVVMTMMMTMMVEDDDDDGKNTFLLQQSWHIPLLSSSGTWAIGAAPSGIVLEVAAIWWEGASAPFALGRR